MTKTEKDVKWWTWASVWMLFSAAVLVAGALAWRHQYATPPQPTKGYTQVKVTAKTADGVSVAATVELVTTPEEKAELAPYQGNIAVTVTGILSVQDRDALVDSDNRQPLKQMILERVNKILPPGKKVERVLLTDFLVGGS